MELTIVRFETDMHDTLGLFLVNGVFSAFTLEDTKREVKIMNETRIPSGRYRLAYTYSPRFEKYMIEILNVPNFSGIRIHAGNTNKDTSGCILVGNVCRYNPNGAERIEESILAYERLHGIIVPVLGKEEVWLTIKDSL